MVLRPKRMPPAARPVDAGSRQSESSGRPLPCSERRPAYVQPLPWLAIANKNLELLHKFMTELGLSPVSRSRVSAQPPIRKTLGGRRG